MDASPRRLMQTAPMPRRNHLIARPEQRAREVAILRPRSHSRRQWTCNPRDQADQRDGIATSRRNPKPTAQLCRVVMEQRGPHSMNLLGRWSE